jgi:bifunctional UDP-N-acetylglucosamine pyrophosphorylase/glucosamine-1-phosphate N-acetyltransferase
MGRKSRTPVAEELPTDRIGRSVREKSSKSRGLPADHARGPCVRLFRFDRALTAGTAEASRPARGASRDVSRRAGDGIGTRRGERVVSDIAVIVLAAGQGTRMKSRRAKVLHEVCGVTMLEHVLNTAQALAPTRLAVVVGRDADEVRRRYADRADFVLQAEQRGTGHAVRVALESLPELSGDVLILYGDTPLLRPETIERMHATKRERNADLLLLSAHAPTIPGILVRDESGKLQRIVESQDATTGELAIPERNTGVYLVSAKLLREGVDSLVPHNSQGELYLTDVVGYAVRNEFRVETIRIEDAEECLGVNTRRELAAASRVLRQRVVERLMDEGVTFVDPHAVYIDAAVRIGRDSVIEPGVVITGRSVLGEGCHIKAGCVIEESRIGDDVTIGPSAHLRPGNELAAHVKIGNFVELKNSKLGEGTKAAHLGYIGDADVGAHVNFSCGAIVVNYDGYKKTRSTIGDHAFIGCNANLVSPVEIEPHAFVAAGSTITKNVPTDALAVARDHQRNIEGWVARKEGRAPANRAVPKQAEPMIPDASTASSARTVGLDAKAVAEKSSAPRAASKKSAEKKAVKNEKKAAKKATDKKTAKKATKKTAKRTAKKAVKKTGRR